MKEVLFQLLVILGLVAAAGTIFNLAHSGNSQKYLPWRCSQFYPYALTVREAAPSPSTPPPAGSATKDPAPAASAPAKAPQAPTAGPGRPEGVAKGPAPETVPKGGAAPAPEASGEFPRIGLKEVLDELEHETPFIDARRTREYEAGHIPGAISVCPYEQEDLFDKISRFREESNLEAPVVIYCTIANECESSKMIARHLKEAGFLNLMIYSGGFPEWQKEKPDRIVTGKEPGRKAP